MEQDSLIRRVLAPWRKRAEMAAAADAQAKALIADKGRIGALFAVDDLRKVAKTAADRRRAQAPHRALWQSQAARLRRSWLAAGIRCPSPSQ